MSFMRSIQLHHSVHLPGSPMNVEVGQRMCANALRRRPCCEGRAKSLRKPWSDSHTLAPSLVALLGSSANDSS